jgi:hypothetical protein
MMTAAASLLCLLVAVAPAPLHGGLAPASYDFLGPFPMGKTEFDGDPLEEHGGAERLFRQRRAGASKQRFLSELVVGGYAGWTQLDAAADGSGRAQAQPKVDWNALVSGLSGRAVLEFQGW